MRTVTVLRGEEKIAPRVEVAASFGTRLRGLLGRDGLAEGAGLLLRDCPSIHCFFMRFTIDVVYLDENDAVLAVETVPPWRAGSRVRGARHTLELAEGAAAELRPGDKITFSETENRKEG